MESVTQIIGNNFSKCFKFANDIWSGIKQLLMPENNVSPDADYIWELWMTGLFCVILVAFLAVMASGRFDAHDPKVGIAII